MSRTTAACASIVEAVDREFGRLDVLVNMASLYSAVPFDELTSAEWDKQLCVDLRATFLVSRAAVPLMRRHGGGRIINFSDWVAGERAAALQGLSGVLRREGRREGADRSAGARSRGRPDSRQRDRARADPRAAGHDDRGVTRRSRRRRRSAAGAGRTRSRRPCSRSSTRISSPARRSGSTADGTCTD